MRRGSRLRFVFWKSASNRPNKFLRVSHSQSGKSMARGNRVMSEPMWMSGDDFANDIERDDEPIEILDPEDVGIEK